MAELPGGETVDVWIKAPGLHTTISDAAPAREWMAAKVAEALDLPCPPPVKVRLTPEFVASIQDNDLISAFRAGPEVVFGALHLGSGWRRWSEASSMPRRMHQLHGSAYLFDTIIQNWDRRIANPNILKKGDNFSLIDHEEAFVSATGAEDDRGAVRLPWEVFGITNFIAGDMQHPFWRVLKRSNHVDFSLAAASWKGLPDDTFSLYAADAPDAWGRATCDSIAGYLSDARSNIDAVVDTIERAREQ